MRKINLSEKNIIIFIAAISQLIQQLIANMTVVALPNILVDLNFTADSIMWVNLIYLCVFVAFCIPFSKIISQYGIKKCLYFSIAALLISVVISIFSFNLYMLLLSRFIQGITSASLSVSLYVMVVEGLSEKDLGTALGIVASSGYVGMLIAPSFMGLIIYLANWRLAFLILIPILIVILFLLTRIDKEWTIENEHINYFGSSLYIVMMFLFTLGIATLDEYGAIPLIISFILLIVFIRYEKTHPRPIYDFKLLKDIRYLIGNYAAMVTYFTTTIAITALSFHLQYILNFEEYLIGLVLIISPTIMIGMSGVAGKLSDKIDPRVISGIAMSFISAAMIIFFFIDYISIELIYIGCVFQGLGNGLFSAPNNKYVLTLVEEKDLPDASSFLSSSKEFGKILSSGIYTLILSIFIGQRSLGPDYLDALLIQSSNLMMFINILFSVSAVILLFYSKFKYDKGQNQKVLEALESLKPDWFKRRGL